jgi:hypothetical protein
MIGAPVPAADLVTAYPEGPAEARRLLTARLAEAIRARIVEAEDHYTLGPPAVRERGWRKGQARRLPPSPAPDGERARASQQRVMRGARRAGLVLFPLAWSGQGWLVWRLGGAWPGALFAALRATADLASPTTRGGAGAEYGG